MESPTLRQRGSLKTTVLVAFALILLIGLAAVLRFAPQLLSPGPSNVTVSAVLSRAGTDVTAEVTLRTSVFEVGDVRISEADLGGVAPTDSLPISLGELAMIRPKSVTLHFPAPSAKPGTEITLTLTTEWQAGSGPKSYKRALTLRMP
ncbi:MAG: hypothetical protein IH851_00095 [Armatimonadetes bacterium]|nr:hypothetical protein [Armatimonadota bacterium]